jgi:hypothetical protein
VVPGQIVAVRRRTVMRSNQEPARASKRAESGERGEEVEGGEPEEVVGERAQERPAKPR